MAKTILANELIRKSDNESSSAIQRLVVHGAIAFLGTYLPQVISKVYLPDWVSCLIAITIMALISPVDSIEGDDNELEFLNE